MTMYYISEFCRICLQYDKNLIDIVKIENEPTETLLNKLKLCVSEVEWSSSSILLCQTCIRKLHGYYDFKKQCLISAQTWKTYLELLNESQHKLTSQVSVTVTKKGANNAAEKVETCAENEKPQQIKIDKQQNAFVQMVPNQKLLKLIVGPQQPQNSFQNVFLNLVPTNTISPTVPDAKLNHFVVQNTNVKDTNRNVFLNINNTFQKFIQTPPEQNKRGPKPSADLSKILTQTKTEELSVEIDPTDFGCLSEDSSPVGETNEKDWEDLIGGTKIPGHTAATVPKLVPLKREQEQNGYNNGKGSIVNNYVPILPKPNKPPPYSSSQVSNEEKYEFFNGGHFLTFKEEATPISDFIFPCEMCGRNFESSRFLRSHIKQFHMGKFPYKCDFCYSEFAARQAYNLHMEKHKEEANLFITKESLTQHNFPGNEVPQQLNPMAGESPQKALVTTQQPFLEFLDESGGDRHQQQHTCDVCQSTFFTSNGLLRHKVRKHKQKTKKKYFIKGMKNARCDICNRDFSTQSYLQLHKKLHLKNGPNYRGKVFRNKFARNPGAKATMFMGNDEEAMKVELEDDEKMEMMEEGELLQEEEDANGDDIDMKNVQEFDGNKSDRMENQDTDLDDESNNDSSKSSLSPGLKIKINLKNLTKSPDSQNATRNNEDSIAMDCNLKLTVINDAPLFDDRSRRETKYFCYLEIKSDEELKNADLVALTPNVTKRCFYCFRGFKKRLGLKRHLNNYHLKSTNYRCHLCSNTFYDVLHLGKHLQIHYSSAVCSVCQKMFSSETDMKQHNQAQHADSAFWQCGVCYVLFNDTESLNHHMDEHDKTISYRCHFCGDSFAESGEFCTHVSQHGGLYSCKQCGDKSFKLEIEFNAHLASDAHSKDGNNAVVKCNLCQKMFSKRHELTRHMNLHEKHPHLLQAGRGSPEDEKGECSE